MITHDIIIISDCSDESKTRRIKIGKQFHFGLDFRQPSYNVEVALRETVKVGNTPTA